MSFLRSVKPCIASQKRRLHQNVFVTKISANEAPTSDNFKDGSDIAGKSIAIKDNICTTDCPTTAASRALEDFVSPYDATVVKLLRESGAVISGKTNMDEFGMGSHSVNSHAGPVRMQRYPGEDRSAGGSSGGSALAVASGACWASLGTDTGGSVRLPAAYTGVVGFKPSYGRLSRWGVIAYANSLDTVGILARKAQDVETVFNKLNVYDAQDPTSLPKTTRSRLDMNSSPKKSLRIGVPLDYNIETLQPTVRKTWMRALKGLAEQGHSLHPVRLPTTQHALSAYYILAPAEASSNLAKYDGVRYGTRANGIDGTPESVLFAKTRGRGFGAEVQRRILLGAFSLSAQAVDNYFIQAQKIRRLVQQDFDKIFSRPNPLIEGPSKVNDQGVDVLFCPTAPSLAPALSEVENQDPVQAYMNDVFTVPASLAGLPAMSVPVQVKEEENIARHGNAHVKDIAGMQFIGQYGDDQLVLHAGGLLEEVCRNT